MNFLTKAYLMIGSTTCTWFLLACLFGWRAPSFGVVSAFNSGSSGGYSTGGRSSGGFWGGGK
jgi:hypothetical protein